MVEENKGFRVVYAKSGGRPNNCFFDTRNEVIEFIMNNFNYIDLIVINDVIIDKNKLVNDNLKISRYLKLKRIYEI